MRYETLEKISKTVLNILVFTLFVSFSFFGIPPFRNNYYTLPLLSITSILAILSVLLIIITKIKGGYNR